MAAVRSSVNLTFGVMACTVAVHSAVVTKQANVIVCTGRTAELHEATRIYETKNCPVCGVVHMDSLDKARKTPEGLVLLEPEDLTEIATDAAEYKDRMAMTPHPALDVEVGTVAGSKAYHLVPNRGHQDSYAALVSLLHEHPELAFVTKWTPRSNMAVFRVLSDGTSLFAQERIAGDALHPVPDILPATEAMAQALAGMAEQVLQLPDVVQPFTLEQYRDETEDRIAALVASRTPVPDSKPGTKAAPPVTSDAMLAALQAQLDAAKATTATAKPARKRAAAKRGGA